MNWASLSFDWNHIRAFLATAEEGSLSAAARALRQSQPTLGRQVAALEESLGVVLFERVGRALALTPSGRELLEHVRAMGEAAEHVALTASGQNQAVSGRVSISASDGVATYILPELIAELRAVEPGIEIEVVSSNALSDLQRREADIAIRHVRPTSPELYARLLGEEEAGLYAATSLLDRLGRPRSTEDLGGYPFVGFSTPENTAGQLAARGIPIRREQVQVFSENGLSAWEMVKVGLGITPMSVHIAEQSAGIERVLPDWKLDFPVWLAVHREVRTSRRIRIVFDFIASSIKGLKPQKNS